MERKGFFRILVAILAAAALLGGGAYLILMRNAGTGEPSSGTPQLSVVPGSQELLFSNDHADATVINRGGEYLMYLNRFGRNPGAPGYFVLSSTDGVSWETRTDTIIPNTAVGRAIVMDGGVRLFYPTIQPLREEDPSSVLKSSFSSDGLSFTADPGTRLSPSPGHHLDGATIVRDPEGGWRMYFHENKNTYDSNKESSAIYTAVSDDGLVWTRREEPVLEIESGVEGLEPWPQMMRPFVLARPQGGYFMFYNSHLRTFYAYSEDGVNWEKKGKIIDPGEDTDGYYNENGRIRLYFGERSEATGSQIHTILLEER